MNSRIQTKDLQFEVAVVGGGLTGLCAAIASARKGAKTVLIHDRPVLGGNASGEIRMHICGASAGMKKPELSEGGILHELMLANKRVNDSYNFSVWEAVLFDAAKKEPNLHLFLNTAMHNVSAENGAVRELHCYQLTTELHLKIRARFFLDCTGNGTLSYFAGADYRIGSEGKAEYNEPHAPDLPNNKRMGNTLLFKAIDRGQPVEFIPPVEVMHFTEEQLKFRKHAPDIPPELAKNVTPEELRVMFSGYAQDYGYWWIEICGEKENIIEEYEEIRDQLVAAIYGIWNHIKNEGEHGAANYELTWVGMLPGTRESRRIVCDYMLNENDVLNNHRFADKVAYGGWSIDNHVGLFAFDQLPAFTFPVEGSYDIPYRSYCVKGFRNLFVCGRCMGASKLAMSSTRVMGTCAIGGQAIGTAAALLAQENAQDVRTIDLFRLQQQLLKDDCYLPLLRNEDATDLAATATVTVSDEEDGYPASNLVNGITRAIDGQTNAWRSRPLQEGNPAQISLALKQPAEVRRVQVIFDSNFELEKKITLSSTRQNQQIVGVPPELVQDFEVALLRNGEVLSQTAVTDNFLRRVTVDLTPALCDTVRIRISKTRGADSARVFEVRIYE